MAWKVTQTQLSFVCHLLSNLAAASEEWLVGLTKFRVLCAEQLTIVSNRLQAVLYVVLDQYFNGDCEIRS